MTRPRRSDLSRQSRNAIRLRNIANRFTVEEREKMREQRRLHMARLRASRKQERGEAKQNQDSSATAAPSKAILVSSFQEGHRNKKTAETAKRTVKPVSSHSAERVQKDRTRTDHSLDVLSERNDYLSTAIEKSLGDNNIASAAIKAIRFEVEHLNWQNIQERAECRHNASLLVNETRRTLEAIKALQVNEAVAQSYKIALKEKDAAVLATKRKLRCCNCLKEATLYCCRRVFYCDYSCQEKHWPYHRTHCAQNHSSSLNTHSDGEFVLRTTDVNNPALSIRLNSTSVGTTVSSGNLAIPIIAAVHSFSSSGPKWHRPVPFPTDCHSSNNNTP